MHLICRLGRHLTPAPLRLMNALMLYLDAYRPIGRLFGNLYATQRDIFALTRESHAQWLARSGAVGPSDESQ